MTQMYRQLNDKFMSDIRNDVERHLPKEALRIMKDKFDDFVAYGVKNNLNESEYDSMLWETCNLVENLYDSLDYPSFEKQDESKVDVEGKPKRLWRIYNDDTFWCGSKRWEMRDIPGYFHYSPVDYIDDEVSKYLGMHWLHHPYINWALINAYLLDAGRRT